jgi:hypothetical protein
MMAWTDPILFGAFSLHIAGGTIGLLSGTVAIVAKKGGALHRRAGFVFVLSMLVMALFAAYLAVVIPGQFPNFIVSIFAFYLIATAWLTVWRKERGVGLPEKIAFAVVLALLAPFALLSFELSLGLPLFFTTAIAIKGPILVAMYGFTAVIAIAVISDAKVLLAGGIAGAPRIARHLWRMCLGLTLAAGSAFTNGLPRLLPGPMHVTAIYFVPQFIPLILLVFWMIRVRFTGWYRQEAAAA